MMKLDSALPLARWGPAAVLFGDHAEGGGGVVVDTVGPGNEVGGDEGQGGAAAGVGGAQVHDHMGLEGGDAAGPVEARLDVVHLRPGVVRGHHVLAAALAPAHRPVELERQERHQHLFGIERPLDAEATAHGGRDHPDLEVRAAEGFQDQVGQRVRHLGWTTTASAGCPVGRRWR